MPAVPRNTWICALLIARVRCTGTPVTISLQSNPLLCLDLSGGSTANGSPVQMWDCNGLDSQAWFFDAGSYKITYAQDPSKCIDAGSNFKAGSQLMIWDCDGLSQQKWGYQQGTIYLSDSTVDAAFCMDAFSPPTSGNKVQLWGCNSASQQQFNVLAGVSIRVKYNFKLCLDLAGGKTDNGTPIQIWDCNGLLNQQWIFSGGRVMSGKDSSKCLDAGPITAGTHLWLWDCNQQSQQKWGYDGKAVYLLGSEADASICMDLSGGSMNLGTVVQVWGCNSCWNQQWIVGVSSLSAGAAASSNSTLSTQSHSVTDTSIDVGSSLGCPPQPSPSPAPPAPGSTMLQIDWSRLPDPPVGFEDSDGGWITDDTVVTAFGYSADSDGGGDAVGYLNSAFMYNLQKPHNGWIELPRAPVSGRQEVGAAIIDSALYYVGGFSVSPPYTYQDVLQLAYNQKQGGWQWSTMPSLPYPLCSMGVVAIGSKLFVFGGADFDGQHFDHFSRRLVVLDTAHLSAGWQRLPDVPGSPRWVHAFSGVGTKLYVIGGATGNPVSSVVDNWVFDTVTEAWSRLPDLPLSSTNFQTNHQGVFQNRYIILVGGYQYAHVYNPNGTTSPAYGGTAHRLCPSNVKARGCRTHCAASSSIPDVHYMGQWKDEYNNDVFVFDTETATFGLAQGISSQEPALMPKGCGGFPVNGNVPQVNIRGNRIFVIGGECNDRIIAGEHYTHYPRLAVVGEIHVVGSNERPSDTRQSLVV